MVGELGLDGSVRGVPGMLPIAILAREKNIPNLILPTANAAEAAVVEGVNVYPVSSLIDVLDLLNTSVVGVIQREPYRVATEELLGKLEQFKDIDERGNGIDVDALDDRGFGGVGSGQNQIGDSLFAGEDGDRQHAGDGAHATVEAQLAD